MSGRIRSIKPEWLEDELMAAASDEARVLSVALILMADDHGRGRASTASLAAGAWRYELERDDGANARETLAKTSRAFRELVEMRFVVVYDVDRQRYYEIRNWSKHQKVDKPSKPRVPAPLETLARPSRDPRETLEESPRLISDLRSGSPISDQDLRSPTTSDSAREGLASLVWSEWRAAFGRVPDTGGAAKLDRLLAGELLTVTREESRTVERLRALASLAPEGDPATWLRRAIDAWKADPWAKREGYPWPVFVTKAGELAARAKPNHAPGDFGDPGPIEDRLPPEVLALPGVRRG